MQKGIALIVAAAILGISLLGSAWIITHPGPDYLCAQSGGAWLPDLQKCWYPQSSQPLVVPDPVGALPTAPSPTGS